MIEKTERRKMIALLVIMTPGIPEYLTGSSRITDLFLNPFSFIIGLLFNIGLYTAGALLIREFSIKYRKGWASILLLGCAYGIMEEGIAVHTFFQSSGNPVGLLAIYGRFAGVNWVWAVGLTFFHSIFSITLPLLLLSIAFPKHSRDRLLGRTGVLFAAFFYGLTVVLLNLYLYYESNRAMPTGADYIVFCLISLFLVIVARFIPRNYLRPKGSQTIKMKKFYLLGMSVFPLYALYAFAPVKPDGTGRISPILDIVLYAASYFLIAKTISHFVPQADNRGHILSLSIGLIIPLIVWAEIMELTGRVPLISLVSIIAVIMLIKLRREVRKQPIVVQTVM